MTQRSIHLMECRLLNAIRLRGKYPADSKQELAAVSFDSGALAQPTSPVKVWAGNLKAVWAKILKCWFVCSPRTPRMHHWLLTKNCVLRKCVCTHFFYNNHATFTFVSSVFLKCWCLIYTIHSCPCLVQFKATCSDGFQKAFSSLPVRYTTCTEGTSEAEGF